MSIDLRQIHNVINQSFWQLLSNKNRYLVLRGGRGSGKSKLIAQKIIIRILNSYQTGIKHKFLALRKTQPDVKRSIFELFQEIIDEWDIGHLCKVIKNPATITFTNGSKILCSGLDDPMKLKSIVGITGAWLEEAMEFTYEDFLSVDQIIRGNYRDYFQIILSFNPTNKNSWIYNQFFKDIEQDHEVNNPIDINYPENAGTKATLHLSTYKDNRFLNPEYGLMLESYINTSQFHYNVNCLGEWGILDGLVFDTWFMTDIVPSAGYHIYGCDFGYSNDETAVVKVWKEFQEITLQEKLYKLKMNNDELIRWFKTYTEPNAIVYCDSAEPARIDSMKQAGINAIACIKGAWSVKNGLMYMKEHKINIINGSSNLRKEISGYIWKKKTIAGVLKTLDEPIGIDDHLISAARYAVFTHWFKHKQEPRFIFLDMKI